MSENTKVTTDDTTTPAKPLRGFAAMTPERRAELARRGGKEAHARRTAHAWTAATAREAGRKGGLARRVSDHGRANLEVPLKVSEGADATPEDGKSGLKREPSET